MKNVCGQCQCQWVSPVPSVLHLSYGFQYSPTLNCQPYEGSWWRKLSNMTVDQSSLISLMHHCTALLQLTSRKPLWLDLQLVDIKSRWRHNCKLAQVVNSHLVCDPTIRQPGFDLPQQQWSLLNVFARNGDTAVPAEGNGDLQTLICVPDDVSHCRILSPDKTEWWLISATLCR